MELPAASRVTVQLLGRRQRLTLPEGDDLHEAITEVVAARFEVPPPFSFSNDQGLVLEDGELLQAVEAGAIIVAHLSDSAVHELSRRVRQLRNLQWGLVGQHLEKSRLETATQGQVPESNRPLSGLLAEQFAELRLELKQTLAVRLERLQSTMEERMQALEESCEQRLGSVLKEVRGGRHLPVQEPGAVGAGLQAEVESLAEKLQGDCERMADSVRELREECVEAIQREVRARLEHHRNLQEEVHKEVQQRTQALGHLEREIKELLVMRPVQAPEASRSLALPMDKGWGMEVVPYMMEPVASPGSPYPASLREPVGSPSGSPVRLRCAG